MKARELGRRSVVVGDVVSLAGDVSGRPGTLARIVRVRPRASALRRSADDTDPVERVIVANADQLVIVTALADPPPRPRLIDRFLVAAYDAGLDPLLCLTKSDLAGPEEILSVYEPLGTPYLVLGWPLTDELLGELRDRVADRVSVLVGQSGVGKSTLFNALLPQAERATGEVNAVTGRGRHTSSSALALRLPAAAGSSTRRGCAASGSVISPRPAWSAPSPTWPRGRRRARRAARTWSRTARWTTGWPSTAARPASTRCAACCAAARDSTPPRPPRPPGRPSPPRPTERARAAARRGHGVPASMASDSGVMIGDIVDAAGHVNANITRSVYRHVISDTITRAPAAMDQALASGKQAGSP